MDSTGEGSGRRLAGGEKRSLVLLGTVREGSFGGVWSLYKSAAPKPESDVRAVLPEGKRNKEMLVETIRKSSAW